MMHVIDKNRDICNLFLHADARCRQDLHEGYLVSERDYISAFCTHIRYPLGPLVGNLLKEESIECLLKSFPKVMGITVPGTTEKAFGCDGAILIGGIQFGSGREVFKLGMFEAKWPRLHGGFTPTKSEKSYRWDKDKRFSRQLSSQRRLVQQGVAVWEQFICEADPTQDFRTTSGMSNTGSTCVWHDDALGFALNKGLIGKPWNAHLLQKLLRKHGCSFQDVINAICSCKAGAPVYLEQPGNELYFGQETGKSPMVIHEDNFSDNGRQIDINPVPLFESVADIPAVKAFMRRTGISMYCFVDMRTMPTEQKDF
ncbi:hypothetical protein [Hymenobacter weizhouensis]|uniref:hypothetical protein n=1 Tax=Hymenobacter sp. YIM 151500-1 TaxID=2987689 RepID=UPI0022274B5E|nr:hypothetical protein [Hymenobacter sp. YIM 151500-1]UYZ64200.1 hypothetical protein OIS53_04965 [Hymenobacter sp. YIM 151500-1]